MNEILDKLIDSKKIICLEKLERNVQEKYIHQEIMDYEMILDDANEYLIGDDGVFECSSHINIKFSDFKNKKDFRQLIGIYDKSFKIINFYHSV